MPEHPLAPLERIDPEFIKKIGEMDALVYADGALPRKFKLLIALAFDAAQGAEKGVQALAGRAMAAGATKAEIVDALRVAYQLSGVGALYVAAHGLKDCLD
ncbi:MAG: carboxymuconolactone decarboxylase family protein [Acidobacteriota bacterium]|nr:carboxymuconolactone decarboxylase family protein [Acidobacteriota bacterium]